MGEAACWAHQCFGKCNHGGGRVCKVCKMTCHIQRPQAHPSDDRAKNPGTVQTVPNDGRRRVVSLEDSTTD